MKRGGRRVNWTKSEAEAAPADDVPPLTRMLLLLDRARENGAAWDRIFPQALKAVDDVYTDIRLVRGELEKTRLATRVVLSGSRCSSTGA